MGKDMSDEDLFKFVFNFRDHPVIVSTDIEHDIGCNVIGAGEGHPEISKILPVGLHRELVPRFERRFGSWVFVPEFFEPPSRNHMHTWIFA